MRALSQEEVTGLLLAWSTGEDAALEQLIPLVHQELRRLAHRYMAGERPDHSLQTTALVNEAYLRLVDCRHVRWQDTAHFFATSARLMRRILVDHARSRRYLKRGGGAQRISLDEGMSVSEQAGEDLMALDEVLCELAEVDARMANVVELRFFGGLSVGETAHVLNVCEGTVMRDWRLARAWLLRELSKTNRDGA